MWQHRTGLRGAFQSTLGKFALFLMAYPLLMLWIFKKPFTTRTLTRAYLLYAGVPAVLFVIKELIPRSRNPLGPLLVLLTYAIAIFPTWTFFAHVLPNEARGSTWQRNCLDSSCAVFFCAEILANFTRAIFLDAGLPPKDESVLRSESGSSTTTSQEICKLCRRVRPPRSHHCRSCGRCVLRMDHHCMFTNNCVGLANYRYFLVLAFYGIMYSVWMFFQVRPLIPFESNGSCIAWTFYIAIFVFLALGALASFHAHLVLTNQTTIEFLQRRREAGRNGRWPPNPYNVGFSKNFREVFGPLDKLWQVFLLEAIVSTETPRFGA